MFTVIYRFRVKKDQHKDFIESWKTLTQWIRDYEGGLGSRLHQEDSQTYLAYAQWPDKRSWENSGNRLPEGAHSVREKMRNSLENMETLHQLEVVEDLLVK